MNLNPMRVADQSAKEVMPKWQPALMLDRIEASLASLSPSEQRVGRLCMENPSAFVTMSVKNLAGQAHVSAPTVVRFCRSIGYSGLNDLRSKLMGAAPEGVPFVHPDVDANDKTADVMLKVIDATVSGIRHYRNIAKAYALDKAIAALVATCQEGKRIQFFGVSHSSAVAQDAQFKFFHIGVRTDTYSEDHLRIFAASTIGPGDCAVLFSSSGRNVKLMDVCEVARNNGATVIVMTASGTPLASAGHIHIGVDHLQDTDQYSPMVSRLIQLMLVDILATCVALHMDSEARADRLRSLHRGLRHRPYD